jgi:acetyl esterase/lipase
MNWLPVFRELSQLPPLYYKSLTKKVSPMKMTKIPFGDHHRQYMLVYEPQERVAEQDKVIYFLHGGGWRVGRPERRQLLAELFTSMGYTVVLPTYRLIPKFTFYDLLADTQSGFQHFLQLPQAQGKRTLLMGESAGGNLASLLLYRRDLLEEIGISQDQFAGFVSVVGVLDMDGMPDNFYLRSYNGGRGSAIFHQSNPVNFLQEDEKVPVLIVHGTNDGLVPFRSAQRFAKKLQLIRPDLVDLFVVENGSHISVAGDWLFEENAVRKKVTSWIEGL